MQTDKRFERVLQWAIVIMATIAAHDFMIGLYNGVAQEVARGRGG
jgi:hypothetical protein